MRKLKGDKNGPDPTSNKPSATVMATTPMSGSTSSPTGFLGAPKEKRKAVSVSTPPDLSSSPVHQVLYSLLSPPLEAKSYLAIFVSTLVL